jgi:O-antigen ligase
MIYDGLRLFWQSGGVGIGPANVTYEHSSQPSFGKSNPDDTLYPLHNFPVQLAAQYGIPGLLLFGTSYLSLLFGLHRRGGHSRAPPNSAAQTVEIVRRSGWAFLISFVLISISVSYLFDRRPFYLVFGLYLTVNQYLIRQVEAAASET